MAQRWYDRAKRRLRDLRIRQEDLTDPLNVSRGAVGHYLNGRRDPSPEQLVVLGRVMRCSLHWLLAGEGPVDPPGSGVADSEAVYVVGDEERELCELIQRLQPKRRRAFLDLLRDEQK